MIKRAKVSQLSRLSSEERLQVQIQESRTRNQVLLEDARPEERVLLHVEALISEDLLIAYANGWSSQLAILRSQLRSTREELDALTVPCRVATRGLFP